MSYKEIRVSLEKHRVLPTYALLKIKTNRERMTQIIFEFSQRARHVLGDPDYLVSVHWALVGRDFLDIL